MAVLITGGLGFIGSHVCVELQTDIIIIDNLANSKITVLDKINKLRKTQATFYQYDMLDKSLLNSVFEKHKIETVIHLAGLKAVGESVKQPLLYYQTNLSLLFNLLNTMAKFNCKNLIFSSSATVYGNQPSPHLESTPTGISITNPYGQTKYMAEQILQDLHKSDNSYNITILRYYNPIGAHSSGLLGEDPNDKPNNLMPYILKTADGTYPHLNIFGSDYDTWDGTCERDFIHIEDLAKGHVKAINKMSGLKIYNLGTGKSTSVLDLVECFEETNKIKVPDEFTDRRAGDLPVIYGIVDKAMKELEWVAEKNITDMCKDAWNFIRPDVVSSPSQTAPGS